ncbi:MAG: TIGR02757 family protein [Marinilabiliales bacterium]|nr:MAG: TIGR02757 family protein [Marinilabiliales bacterium]
MTHDELKIWLEEKTDLYNQKSFIETDPISVPHMFSKPEDIEIAGLLTATIAWGNRKSIITSAKRLMERMDMAPFGFIMNHSSADLKKLDGFVHRTFNSFDAATMMQMLQNIIHKHGSLKNVFCETIQNGGNAMDSIEFFRTEMLHTEHENRFEKHISSPAKGSAAKRLNMYLRWMVRKDNNGVDFGLWNDCFPMSKLMIPLDIHSGRVARNLGLLDRNQNDAKAVRKVTEKLREFDPDDPIKYDFAIFGSGIFENLA